MRGVGGCLIAKLASRSDLHAHEPLLEASMGMAGKLAAGGQSDHGVNAGGGMCYQVARFGGPLLGVRHARLVGRGVVPLRGLADRGAIAIRAWVIPA
jgi:hypothetical protein